MNNLFSLFNRFTDNKFIIFLDQSFFAFFNFGSIFLLSKLASVTVFSSFVIFQSYIFFIFIFSTFFLSAPILVLLAKKWREKQESYLATLLFTNFLISFIIAIVCFIFMRQQGVYIHFIFVFLVPFLMSMFDIIKKFLFSSFRIHLRHAVISSILLNASFFLAVFILKDILTLRTILILYAGAYLLANLYLFVVLFLHKILHKTALKISNYKRHQTIEIVTKHYKYSKWIILGGIAFWGYSQGLYIFSKALDVSDFAISKVRTIHNILGVVNIFIISVENFYTPHFSEFIKDRHYNFLREKVKELYKKYTFKILLLMLSIFVFALVFYEFLYQEKYRSGMVLIVIFTVAQLLLFLLRPLIISLKASEITKPFFYAHLAGVITMFVSGYFLIKYFGDEGMAWAFFAAHASFSLVVFYFYTKRIKRGILNMDK